MLPEGPIRWLVLANLAWLLLGLVAYATPVDLPILTVLVLVLATVGIRQLEGDDVWHDRAMSAVAGAWAVLAVMILLPYMGLEEGSLWDSRSYVLLSLGLASLAVLAWNACMFQATAPDERVHLGRSYALFHVAVLIAALIVGRQDGVIHELIVRGEMTGRLDLQWAPLLAVVPGLVWAMALRQDK